MIFELSKKGTLPTFSRLQNEVKFPNQLDSILDLKYPTGITYHGVEGTVITAEHISRYLNNEQEVVQEIRDRILQSKSSNIIFKDVEDDSIKSAFITFLQNLLPNINIQEIKPEGIWLDFKDVRNAINLQNVSGFNKVLSEPFETVIFDETVSEVEKKEFLRMLNKHSNSNFKGKQKTSALKNSVVHKIINLLKHPRLHVPSHTPINMDVLQKLASKSALSKREKTLTSDSPLVKFIMQVQNMIGKDVIGITAVGMKVFFAMSTFVNERVVELVDALKNGDNGKARECLYDIIYVDKSTGMLSTIANVNLEPIYEYLNQFEEDIILDFDVHGETSLKRIFAEVGIKASLKDTLEARKFLEKCGLSEEEVRTMEEEAAIANIDAADSISQLLSAATDNAKELILAKINATADFADSWVYLMTSGWSVEEIGNLLMSPVFGIVSEYTKTDVFSDLIKGSSPEKAIKFVLGKSQLSGINLKALKLIMGAYRKKSDPERDSNCFANKLIYETYSEDTTDSNGTTHWRGELKLDRFGNPIKRVRPLLTETELEDLIGENAQGTDFRKNIFSILGRCESTQDIIDSTERCRILEEHLEYVLRTKIRDNKETGLDDSELEFERILEEINEDSYESEEVVQDEFDEFGNEERKVNNEDFGANDDFKVTIKDTRDLYRYTRKYLLPKQNRLLTVVTDPEGNGIAEVEKLKNYYENIYPGVKEQQMCGTSLGVNQGMKTDQYAFYASLKKMQNFINEALPNEKIPFNIYDFLMDKKIIEQTPIGPVERSYREEWIRKYDTVKIKVNPLKLIWGVDHFREMYKLNAMAYKFMNHSFAAKLNFKLEALLLKDTNQILSEEEWKVLDKYTRDLIMMNWLFSKNITFTVPVEKIGDKTKAVMTWAKNDSGEEVLDSQSDRPETITLQDAESAASFIHVFETYIVPYMKEHYPNAFTKNIETGHVLSKVHNHLIMHKKLSMNTMMIDSSSKTKAEYAEILKAFNDISDEMIPEIGLTVKDALFIYNTLVYKNAFTENGFTRLMESVNLIKDDSLINDYSAFIAALDYGDVDLGNIDGDISSLIDDDSNLQLGAIKGNLKDLMYRLSFTSNASHKFNVASEKNSNGAVVKLRFVDMFDHDIAPAIDVDNANPNDWTLDMPVYGQVVFNKRVKGYGEGKQKRFTVTSKEVMLAIKDSLIEKFGLQGKVQEIREEDIREAWDNPDTSKLSIRSAAEYQRIRKAKAFMNNGVIYLNMDNMSGETMLHEIMHVIFAGAKFNKDPEVQKVYYGLLDAAMKYIKQPKNRELYVKLSQSYSDEKGSDFKEEVLIHLLTESFMKQMTVKFGGVRFDSDIKPFVVDLINDICETNVPHNADAVKLGNTTIDNLFIEFKSGLLDLDGNSLTTVNIQLSQKLKTLKRILIQAGRNGKNSYIKYNC